MNKYIIIAALIALPLVFFAGRYTAPTKIKTVEIENRVEIHHEVKETKVDLEEIKTLITQMSVIKKSNLQRTTTTTTKPTGETTTTETVTDKGETNTQTKTDSTSHTKLNVDELVKLWKESTQTKTTIVEKTVDRKDRWSVGVQAGMSLRDPFGSTNQIIPGVPEQVILGAFVERNLFWGINLGLWANSRLDGGVQARIGF